MGRWGQYIPHVPGTRGIVMPVAVLQGRHKIDLANGKRGQRGLALLLLKMPNLLLLPPAVFLLFILCPEDLH